MSLGTFSSTPACIFDRLKEFISSIHTLKLSIGYHTPRFVLLSISFHVFKYLLGLKLGLINLFLVLLLILGFLSDHSFELLLNLEQVSHLQHKAHPPVVTQPVVHAHQRVLVHVLLNSTRLVDFFLCVLIVHVFYVVPHISLKGSYVIVIRQIFNGHCEILCLYNGFSDFLIGF